MRVKLLADGRDGRTGETVEVSPERAAFLMSIGAAEPAKAREQAGKPEEKAEKPAERPARKPAAKKAAAKRK